MSQNQLAHKSITYLSKMMQEPEWLEKRRHIALDAIETLSFPEIERSHYKKWYTLTPSFPEKSIRWKLQEKNKETANKVEIMPLQEAWVSHETLLKKHFMRTIINETSDKIAAHHLAHLNAGWFIYIPENYQGNDTLSLPIHLNQDVQNGHVFIYAEKNSQLDIVEKISSTDNSEGTHSIMVEIIANEDAIINYSAIDLSKANHKHFVRRYAYLKRQASIDWAIGSMSDAHTVVDTQCYLQEIGSQTDIKIVGISHGKQEQTINTYTLNQNKNTISRIFQHGAILEQSCITFNAIGEIEKGSKQADSQQESRLLMFQNGGRGDANPILLINEYDLTAGHAASVGQIDAEQLYYLMSRGIDKKTAMKLAVRGFLGPVITAIPVESIQQELIETIERKLAKL